MASLDRRSFQRSRAREPARQLDGVEKVLQAQSGIGVALDQQSPIEEHRVGVDATGRQQQVVGGARRERDVDPAMPILTSSGSSSSVLSDVDSSIA